MKITDNPEKCPNCGSKNTSYICTNPPVEGTSSFIGSGTISGHRNTDYTYRCEDCARNNRDKYFRSPVYRVI